MKTEETSNDKENEEVKTEQEKNSTSTPKYVIICGNASNTLFNENYQINNEDSQ